MKASNPRKKGNSVNCQQCEFGFLQNPFKEVKFIELLWQNNPSGNSHILLNTRTELSAQTHLLISLKSIVLWAVTREAIANLEILDKVNRTRWSEWTKKVINYSKEDPCFNTELLGVKTHSSSFERNLYPRKRLLFDKS